MSLSPQDFHRFLPSAPSPAQSGSDSGLTVSLSSKSQHASIFLDSCYDPPPARYFTPDELRKGCNRVTRKTSAHKIIEHPVNAIVEYPETGENDGECVAHVFNVDPDSFKSTHPKASFQYSLGDGHGGRDGVECHMLRDLQGWPVLCKVFQTNCKGLKLCSARPHDDVSHHFVSRTTIAATDRSYASRLTSESTAEKEVFLKTLGFFCALKETGCHFTLEDANREEDNYIASDSVDAGLTCDQYMDNIDIVFDDGASRSSRRPRTKRCQAKLLMEIDKYNQPFIRCRLHSPSCARHLKLGGLQEYDTQYLRALLEDDWDVINRCENTAKLAGYGPRCPCDYVASPWTQSQLCPHWHRGADMKLKRGVMRKWASGCSATFQIFVPHDITACSRIVILCRNPHSHPPPVPGKTPPALKGIFFDLLSLLKWKLADATPRRIFLDTAFVEGLQQALSWDPVRMGRNVTLPDLHPSFANLDHMRRLINTMRKDYYPRGTGYDGAVLLAEHHAKLPPNQQYVRCVETHPLGRGSVFKLIICMTTRMSQQLMQAKRLSIDTSFKRAKGWQEFEIESWDVNCRRSIVGARAFTTSQTAQAHLILFRRIFDIAKADTGLDVHFRHIHGDGIESVVADSHKGQGLGLGMYCVELSRGMATLCVYDTNRFISSMAPYDHLRCFYRLCITHFYRNIQSLDGTVPKDVLQAMRSLASAERHPDIEATLTFIRTGGPKATAWLTDKIEGTKFALPALYQPKSLIPLAIWKASPSTTNGNEQAHRNIYREGINLTLLAGIMKGMIYDQAAMVSIDMKGVFGINTRDAEATEAFRAARSISRKVRVHQKHIVAKTQGLRNVQHAQPPLTLASSEPLHIPPSEAQISRFSTLMWALTPGARIFDYYPSTTLITNKTTDLSPPPRLSTYSSLEGVFGE